MKYTYVIWKQKLLERAALVYIFAVLCNTRFSRRQLESHFCVCLWETPPSTQEEMSTGAKKNVWRYYTQGFHLRDPDNDLRHFQVSPDPRVRILIKESRAARGAGWAGGGRWLAERARLGSILSHHVDTLTPRSLPSPTRQGGSRGKILWFFQNASVLSCARFLNWRFFFPNRKTL